MNYPRVESRLTDARQVVRQRNAALESLALDEFQSQLSLVGHARRG